MSKSVKLSRYLLATTAAFGALALTSTLGSQPARAYDCLLDTNNDGDADSNVDTDGGADSAGNSSRLACGAGAVASGADATAIGNLATASGTYSTAISAGELTRPACARPHLAIPPKPPLT